jgi:NAD(P)-dependent dehydrogenase (short-subunit alcohol dehydrogenase family)
VVAADLGGRVALVTGAGRGLGEAHARELARAGAAVVVNDIGVDINGDAPDFAVAERVAAAIRADGGKAVAETSDVAGFAGATRAVEHTVAEFGRIDILVNNAGIIGAGSALDSITQDELERLLAVHTVGTVGAIAAALPHMRRAGFGRIVNTTSEASLATDIAAGAAYAAAKSAVWGITMSASKEAGAGITVNAVSPGALTRMSEGFLLESGIPDGLDLSPAQVSRVVVALCTEEAGRFTGRVPHTAGGFVREYVLRRRDDTDLAEYLREQLLL